jgi:hypothetical protein
MPLSQEDGWTAPDQELITCKCLVWFEEKKFVRLKQEMNALTSLSVGGAATYKFVVTSRQRRS